ncbi:MAG: universal stress protein [Halobacteriales archaeon]|nr:universal stress protein [Halobacteriales archaeon]
MAKNVLVPLDGSEGAEKAFEFALEEFSDARLTLLHVVDPSSSEMVPVTEGSIPFDDETRESIVEKASSFLDEYAQTAEEEGIDVKKEYKVGEPAREIVEYTEEEGIDHIVMGSHGRRGVTRVLLGSVAEDVTRRSPVPVTVVR